ncbi:MAG: potassium channel family protein [Terriglobales bacterium]
MKPLRNFLYLVTALAMLIVAGMAGFHYLEGWPWFDSLYMVVTTLTTVGYMEIHPLSETGRVFNLVFIVAGVAMMFLAIGLLTQALLEFELSRFVGRRRMEREIGRLSGHYIICGAGRVGRSVARELAAKPAPFVMLDTSPAKTGNCPDAWPAMVADATKEETLRRVRIEHARGLVAATTTDATNIYIVLTARSLNPALKIIARASEEGSEKHLVTAGADSVISPYVFAGNRIAQSFLRPHVLNFLDLAAVGTGDPSLEIEEVYVDQGSSFAGQTIEGSKIRQSMGVIVLAIKRAGEAMRFNPAPDDRIEAGDYLIAMGRPDHLRQLELTANQRR